jgi:hypothetical protein
MFYVKKGEESGASGVFPFFLDGHTGPRCLPILS